MRSACRVLHCIRLGCEGLILGNYRLPYWISQTLLTDILQQNCDRRLISLHPMIEEISGTLFNVVFEWAANGDMIVSKRPNMSGVERSEAQNAHRARLAACAPDDRPFMLDLPEKIL